MYFLFFLFRISYYVLTEFKALNTPLIFVIDFFQLIIVHIAWGKVVDKFKVQIIYVYGFYFNL